MPTLYEQYKAQMSKLADLSGAMATLHWDQEVNMPKNGAASRGKQIATLSAITHEQFTNEKIGNLLNRMERMTSLDNAQKKNIAITRKQYDKATRFDEAFVIKRSQAISHAFASWIAARQADDYGIYKDALQEIIDIKKEEAKIIGYKDHPYDALLDEYEPGLTTARVTEIFDHVKSELKPLLKKIRKSKKISTKILKGHFDKDIQWQYGLNILKQIGYDFESGRQDISEHPFSTSLGPGDIRVTTRIDESDFCNMLFSTIHEGGHALYEQGLPASEYGLATGSYISLSIHESQSRLWENHVGRSKEFWSYNYPSLQQHFPRSFKKKSLKKFYKAINAISPGYIRTEADELHYHFHVIIRFEIEQMIMKGEVSAKELKELWNEKYKEYLGIKVKSDKLGVLQDVHWAHGGIGYFPTYSLGSFYAAQFYQQAVKDKPKIESKIEKGDHSTLLKWLRKNIHNHGRRYEAEELCERITGEQLNVEHFLRYARKKYGKIYGF